MEWGNVKSSRFKRPLYHTSCAGTIAPAEPVKMFNQWLHCQRKNIFFAIFQKKNEGKNEKKELSIR